MLIALAVLCVSGVSGGSDTQTLSSDTHKSLKSYVRVSELTPSYFFDTFVLRRCFIMCSKDFIFPCWLHVGHMVCVVQDKLLRLTAHQLFFHIICEIYEFRNFIENQFVTLDLFMESFIYSVYFYHTQEDCWNDC